MINLTNEEWWTKAQADKNAVILDVRTEDECVEGIIPNAINIDINKGQVFIYQVEELDKSKNYYVYCRAGVRSVKAAAIMEQLGFPNIFNLETGFMNWEGPIE